MTEIEPHTAITTQSEKSNENYNTEYKESNLEEQNLEKTSKESNLEESKIYKKKSSLKIRIVIFWECVTPAP